MAIAFSKVVDSLAGLPSEVKKQLESELLDIASSIESEAKSNHRFESQTGKLESATHADYVKNSGVYAYLDTGTAPYASYVHDGQRSWRADPFLEKAFRRHIKDIDKAIARAWDRAMDSWR
jgi:HK97 gp10 family phage protein